MNLNKEQISVFFFGSPGDGFTSYPIRFSNLVSGLDKSSKNYKLECKYLIKQNKSIINYVEYGLTGIGQDRTSSRGGRNFGIWIELIGHKISDLGQQKILTYINEFIQNGIMKNADIFSKDSHKSKHYLIFSFDEVSDKLDQLIDKLEEHFITDFDEYLLPTIESDNYVIDLNPIKEIKKVLQPNFRNDFNTETIDNDNKVDEKIKEKYSFDYHKLITLVLLVLFIALFISHIIHIKNNNNFKIEIEKKLNNKGSIKFEEPKQISNQGVQKLKKDEEDKTIDEEDKTKEETDSIYDYVEVTSINGAKGLWNFVNIYNKQPGNKTHTLEEVRELNDFKGESPMLKIGEKIKFIKKE